MKTERRDLLLHENFLTVISIILFFLCKKVFPQMNTWIISKKINETSYPEKEDFCSNLNMEDITDADYIHAKRVCKNFYRKKDLD